MNKSTIALYLGLGMAFLTGCRSQSSEQFYEDALRTNFKRAPIGYVAEWSDLTQRKNYSKFEEKSDYLVIRKGIDTSVIIQTQTVNGKTSFITGTIQIKNLDGKLNDEDVRGTTYRLGATATRDCVDDSLATKFFKSLYFIAKFELKTAKTGTESQKMKQFSKSGVLTTQRDMLFETAFKELMSPNYGRHLEDRQILEGLISSYSR